MNNKQEPTTPKNLNPREKAHLKLEQMENGDIPTTDENKNNLSIFKGTNTWKDMNIIQKFRAFMWFMPDRIFAAIHKLRPFSYLFFYLVISVLMWQTVSYAAQNPESALNPPKEQILTEGVVGKVSSLNPLFITHNQIDRDIQSLIFNQLVDIDSTGTPQPEIAETWAVSADGKSYTFFLRDDVYWHDGKKLTAEDVIFTVETAQKIQDSDSYAEVFKNVKISKIDDFTVIFELEDPNSAFIQSLSIGIVPKHILENTSISKLRYTQFNNYPIGTGPFIMNKNDKVEVVLLRNNDYFVDKPKLEKIKYIFYPDEETAELALKQYQIHSLAQPSQQMIEDLYNSEIHKTRSFPMILRSKLIYFNLRSEDSAINSNNVRHALSYATDRQEIIENIHSAGLRSPGPIHSKSWAYNENLDIRDYNQEKAREKLNDAGWKLTQESQYRIKDGETLTLTLTLLNSEANNALAKILQTQWREVGVKLVFDTQKYDKIASETVPRRDFELLLFEIETTPDPDKYSLLHSSKSEYPGLNLSGYDYQRADILLERARQETDQNKRKNDYDLLQTYVLRDMPMLYLYHPQYSFIIHKSVKGVSLQESLLPQDRYATICDWYID